MYWHLQNACASSAIKNSQTQNGEQTCCVGLHVSNRSTRGSGGVVLLMPGARMEGRQGDTKRRFHEQSMRSACAVCLLRNLRVLDAVGKCELCNPSINTTDYCDSYVNVYKFHLLQGEVIQLSISAMDYGERYREPSIIDSYATLYHHHGLRWEVTQPSDIARCRKGLSALKSLAVKGIKRCHLCLLYQRLILSIVDVDLGLATLSQSNHRVSLVQFWTGICVTPW